MKQENSDAPTNANLEDPDWFREPNPRERRIAAALFVGFGVFFIAMFFVLLGWWFRWVVLTLGAYSILTGIRHLRARAS